MCRAGDYVEEPNELASGNRVHDRLCFEHSIRGAGRSCGAEGRARTPRHAAFHATRGEPTAEDREAGELIDTVLADWLRPKSKMPADRRPPAVVILLGKNLPPGYAPKVEGWTVLRAEEADPQQPPPELTAGNVRYRFDHHPSYPALRTGTRERTRERASTRGTTTQPTEQTTVEVEGPLVLVIDSLRIDGGAAVVQIAQNHHHNLGSSGAKYEAKRTAKGWECQAEEVWKS